MTMAINPTSAIEAFSKAAKLGGEGMEPREAPSSTFLDMLGKVTGDAVGSGKAAEALTAKAVVGQAELVDVVQAVSNAEMTLQTVVAVRDRMMNAYQEIMRMPI
jgi:flagellar hook-basal body complex protein FliE